MKDFILILTAVFAPLCAMSQNNSIHAGGLSKELQEVVVKVTKPLSKLDNDGIVTTIAGTPLQSLENANDVLRYIPGVINSNGSIEVVGRGRPVIYINGRKLINNSELTQLPAAKVKDIKVINNPGARYGGSTDAVIRISTVKELGDGFAFDNRSTLGLRNYIYGKEQLNLNYRTGGLDVFGFFEYDNTRAKGSGCVTQNLWGNHHQHSTVEMNTRKRAQAIDGKVGFNYITQSGHSFGAFYQNIYKSSKSDVNNNSATVLDGDIQSESEATNHNRDNHYEHLVDAYYSGSIGKWSIDATFDYLWRKTTNSQQISEDAIGRHVNDMSLNDNSHGGMFAGEFNISRPLWKGQLEFGAEYTNTRRADDFTSNSPTIDSNNNEVKEYNAGAYAQLMQRFGHVTLQAGMRYEHIGSDYYESGWKIQGQSGRYNELLPSASLVVPIKNTMFQLSYSRKFNRPLYSQLSNTVHYINQYTYETGNPNLKSTFIDNVSLNFRYKWLMVMASYKHIDNRIITACTEYEGNPDITLYRKENSKRDINNIEFMVSAMPGFIGKYYYPVAMVGLVSQFYDIDYKGGIMHMNNPMTIMRLNNMFRLPNNYMINANLSYRSDFDSENIHMHGSWQIDLSASKNFNSHWDVRLTLNDILNTARKSAFTVYSGMRDVHNIRFNTMRGGELSISYKFNTTKSKYKGKGAGNSERERL